jgi:TatD DNase family protein
MAVEANQAGVSRMVTVGTSLEESRGAIRVAAENDGVWATAGVHPHDAVQGVDGIEELLADPMVVAVGECGLDYHYDHSPRRVQRAIFAAQIGLAHRHGLPLVVHSRSAWADTFAVLDSEGVPDRIVFHCFTGGTDEADECLARGALLSFSGIVTFPNADEVRAAAAICPLDRLVVETDTPYLTPVPHRGEANRPALVPLVGRRIAEIKGLEPTAVESATTANASGLYGLTDPA